MGPRDNPARITHLRQARLFDSQLLGDDANVWVAM